MENEMFKLIEINPINDTHAMQCIEAFNYYIIRPTGICHCDDTFCDAHRAQWTRLGDHHGDGCNNEYEDHQLRQADAAFD